MKQRLRSIVVALSLLPICNFLIRQPHIWNLVLLFGWVAAQWTPIGTLRNALELAAWQHWENASKFRFRAEPVPEVDVQVHKHNLLHYIEESYGTDWRQRPLLLRGLWTHAELQNTSRRLSLSGLLRDNLTIPFFSDARQTKALTPDAVGSVRDIVANISAGRPHKVGTQLLVQSNPELILEVAPVDIVTNLFGNFFTPTSVQGTGPWNMFPALTTVPVFVARVHVRNATLGSAETGRTQEVGSQVQPVTALHCEPIGNIAVQLAGEKQWTLVQPEFSFLLRPSTAPDGRAFFASSAQPQGADSGYDRVPSYKAVTKGGDALWVPTWTWHRVDYLSNSASNVIAIGGSLFHFRPRDFILNNPLFAALIIPSLFLELVGWKSQ